MSERLLTTIEREFVLLLLKSEKEHVILGYSQHPKLHILITAVEYICLSLFFILNISGKLYSISENSTSPQILLVTDLVHLLP